MLDLLKTPLFILKVRQRAALREVASLIKGTVVDMGCGSMPYRHLLDCERYWGMDYTVTPDGGQHVRASAQEVPVRSSVADAVICTEVLEHLRDPTDAVVEAARVLKDAGLLYVTAPMSWCLHYEPHDYFRFTPHGLRHLLEANGFTVEWDRRIGGVFSLVGVRLADVFAACVIGLLGRFSLRWAEIVAALFVAPLSGLAHLAALVLDRIDARDALGWAMLARKSPGPPVSRMNGIPAHEH